MKEGSVVLTPLPQADGQIKNRPTIALREMPPYGDFPVCGISTQLHQQVLGFDEIIERSDADYATSGLKSPSLIQLGFLAVLPASAFIGSIGFILSERHQRLLQRLSAHLYRREANR
ncbi:MAG: transcriptional regulator [Verrucomicrobia bacterium]|nr:transcriptional regulator [Verrucomicrobiota bacterium]